MMCVGVCVCIRGLCAQAIREGLDAQRPPPNTHHGTGTVLPGGGFLELHAAGVVSGYTVLDHVERYAETWMQSSPPLVSMLHGFRSHALEFVELDVLTQVTSVYELNRVVGIQMQHLYRAVILHNEAMVALKAEVRRVVAENGHLLDSALEVDMFKRFLRQTWLMLDDSLITMLHRRCVAVAPLERRASLGPSTARATFGRERRSPRRRTTYHGPRQPWTPREHVNESNRTGKVATSAFFSRVKGSTYCTRVWCALLRRASNLDVSSWPDSKRLCGDAAWGSTCPPSRGS